MRTWIVCICCLLNIFIGQDVLAENFKSILEKANFNFERKEYIPAIDLYRKAYSLGDSITSPFRIGEMYINGNGVTANEAEGIKWITIAANNNNAEAQIYIAGYYYERGDQATSFDWIIKAARNGDEEGKYILGQFYLRGEGTVQDSKRALRWILSSAQNGNPDAQWEMAKAYFEGSEHPFNFDKNAEEFISWTSKAAENGSAVALYYMGMIYLDGFNNTPIDKEVAKKWLLKSADKGYKEAINTLKERF